MNLKLRVLCQLIVVRLLDEATRNYGMHPSPRERILHVIQSTRLRSRSSGCVT